VRSAILFGADARVSEENPKNQPQKKAKKPINRRKLLKIYNF
jgi:hypothetical protein